MKFKYIVAILALSSLLINVCMAQETAAKNELYDKEYKWHIVIPDSFKSLSAEDYAKVQEKGTKAMEQTMNGPIENHSKPIFVFKADQAHYFESNSQPFDPAADGDFAETSKAVDDILYKTMASQIPGAKIDSVTTTEDIDNRKFQRFSMEITLPNKVVLHMLMYNRLFDKKELTITILYVDKDKGDAILTAWRNSKFD